MTSLAFTWIATAKDEGKLLRDFLLSDKNISRQLLTAIKYAGGEIIVNEHPVTVRAILGTGDKVTVVFPEEKRSKTMKSMPYHLPICYEDAHFLIIDKPPALTSIPSRQNPNQSLAQAILYYYETQGIRSAVHIVTRLDRDTSGLVLVAKHRYAHSLLAQQQRQQHVQRLYTAIVHGIISEGQGTINQPISRKAGSIIERTINPKGQEAVTHYDVLKRYQNKTVIRVALETGRTHQIRVHFSAKGFPLVGDDLYGGKREGIERQALHSSELHFYHPFNEKTVSFQTPMPSDMASIIQ